MVLEQIPFVVFNIMIPVVHIHTITDKSNVRLYKVCVVYFGEKFSWSLVSHLKGLR